MNHFLFKTEPSSYSIDDLKRDKVTSWGGVRNYQARNIIRDEMKKGDWCVLYHSSCAVPAAVGVGKITRVAYPDPLQFDKKSAYYDAGSTQSNPRWLAIDVKFRQKFLHLVTLSEMRSTPELSDMRLLARGNRLSVFGIAKRHFETIVKLAK